MATIWDNLSGRKQTQTQTQSPAATPAGGPEPRDPRLPLARGLCAERPAATKRVKGVQVFRPFVFGTEAQPFGPDDRPAGIPADHTHKWRIFVAGVDGADVSYWLKKVQFKLHETYAQCVRNVERPPFEVHETGWGEFEIQVKLYFVPESLEKPQTLWHTLTLHPYGEDAEGRKARREVVRSVNYEEVVFNEPVEQFYDTLTGGAAAAQAGDAAGAGGSAAATATTSTSTTAAKKHTSKASSASAKQAQSDGAGTTTTTTSATGSPAATSTTTPRTAEIPYADSPTNPFSQKTEARELDRIGVAIQTVSQMIKEERARLEEKELRLAELRKSEGVTGPVRRK
ncbi:NuA4 histone H4 acetyltransferase complex and the SWR1 complex subunit [Ascosphaera acerosa]|nr:NuA4 histone H4 acetyltransferase complex and the SWR1 complex subunit [Ascosphaera acerosa]